MKGIQVENSKMKFSERIYTVFHQLLKYKYLYLLILPGMLYFAIFHYAQMYGIILAFKKFVITKSMFEMPWVGLDNFRKIFKYQEFWIAFKNTLVISFGKLIFTFPAPIILALLLNELKNQKFKKITQSILYLPHFMSWVILAGLMYSMFSVTIGVIPKLLSETFGIDAIRLLDNPDTFRPLIYWSSIWQSSGWGTIIYLAAIAGIDPSMYEAAKIDGANRFKQVIYITLPSLAYAIVILLIMRVGHVMEAGFDQVFNLYSPATYGVGDIIDTYVYRLGIVGGGYDVGTAVSLFKSVINCTLLLSANWIAKLFKQQTLF